MATTGAAILQAGFPHFTKLLRQSDILLACGIVGILVVLILPLPALLLDLLLAVSITLSVLVLMTALFIERPLDFNVFPTVLLLTTLLRLAPQRRLDAADPDAWPRAPRRRATSSRRSAAS